MAKRNDFKVLDQAPSSVDVLTIRYVALSTMRQWDRNFKRHDIGGVIASIRQHGFKDPIRYEPSLNNGKGGIVEGNGRTEALREWKKLYDRKEQEYSSIPRGVIEKDGEWYAPMIFGVDAKSQAAAEAYAIDHNNLTMTGADFGFNEIMKMWTDDVVSVLIDLPDMPVSMGGVTADMLKMLQGGMITMQGGEGEGGSEGGGQRVQVFRVRVTDDDLLEDVGNSLVALVKRKGWGDAVTIEA